MTPILLAVDEFSPEQNARLDAAVAGWGRITRLPMMSDADAWRRALTETRAEVVVGWPPAEVIAQSGVRLLQIGSSGWDAYQGKGLAEAGVAVCNGRGVYSVGVAEHAVGMMMALVRRLPTHVHDKDQRLFRRHLPYAAEIAGTTAAVVGLGDIGTEVAKRCRGLGMRVVGVARRTGVTHAYADEIRVATDADGLKTALADADHVFLVMPGSSENVGLISREVLESLKPTACLYNLSRGTTVDEVALGERLRDGQLGGAGLDVTTVEPLPADSPLWALGDHVLITGHSGGVSRGHPERFCQLIVRNLEAYAAGKPLENRVL